MTPLSCVFPLAVFKFTFKGIEMAIYGLLLRLFAPRRVVIKLLRIEPDKQICASHIQALRMSPIFKLESAGSANAKLLWSLITRSSTSLHAVVFCQRGCELSNAVAHFEHFFSHFCYRHVRLTALSKAIRYARIRSRQMQRMAGNPWLLFL